ncbi:PREDICTED: prostatic acid phosphatase-like isoform X1 [Atta colombica]|uniref:prostatic acid phosphatase-like isoform X1 n=2 Tax=Atta colombica TaxID=520822 RepID=UPI00084C7EE3|nr:PREDICTED: prostatic acid phosphatase-like isoform X1 [Atta colombica]
MDTGMLLLVLTSVLTSCSGAGDLDLGTIVFANVLYRHGDRTPIAPYMNDPYKNESLWPVPFGQLTNIGKYQHLLLGRWLRKRYSGFLSDIYTPHDIYIQSTDVDRTLMSAEVNLAGLYPPVKNEIWDNNIYWIPIPVHTIPAQEDYVLKASKYCPRYKYELEKLLTSPEMENIKKANAKLFAYLTEHSGENINSIRAVEHLYDNLYIETLYNKTLPQWTKSVFPEELKPLAILSFMIEAYNKILQRLKAGPLLGEMIDHMVKKAQHILQPDRKIWIYSAHDETIGNLLMTLNVFDPHPPPYAAVVLIELRTNLKNQYFVTVSYKNTTEEPILMTLPGCDTLCPLNEFINLTKNVVPEDWERECQISRNEISSSDVIAILTSSILMLVLLVLIIIGFIYWRHKKEHRQYYFRLAYNGYNDAI